MLYEKINQNICIQSNEVTVQIISFLWLLGLDSEKSQTLLLQGF